MDTKLMTGVVNSTNADFGNGFRVHVQTEIASRSKLIVSCVMYKGQCLYRTERSYEPYLHKPNLTDVLPRVASALHQKVLYDLPRIWELLTAEQIETIEIREKQHTVRPSEEIDTHTTVLQLLEEGLAVRRTDPDKALRLWKRALGIEPTNRICLSNINRLNRLRRV